MAMANKLRAAIAEGLRPTLEPEVFVGYKAATEGCSLEEIIAEGWAADPAERPSFKEMERRLEILMASLLADERQAAVLERGA